jgi:hypothetical protein
MLKNQKLPGHFKPIARAGGAGGPWHICIILCFILLHLTGALAGGEEKYVDVIDPATQFQTIDYFTASDCWSMQEIGGWSDASREKVADLLFSREKGIGLSAWRFNLGGGIEHSKIPNSWHTAETFEVAKGKYDWSRCENARWFLAAAKARGVKTFIAFCNSPPRRLTLNGMTSGEKDPSITSNLKPGMESQYGDYLGDILLHFRDNPDAAQRIAFNWVSPINEPQWDWIGGQEGSRASNADILRQYRAINLSLRTRKLSTHILGPESGSVPDMYQFDRGVSGKYKSEFGDYADLLCNDAMAPLLDRTICYHSYWSEDPKQIIAYRTQLRAKMDQHPSWRIMESEFCIMQPGRDLGMDAALRAMRVVHCDLSIVNACAWSWWLAISNVNFKDGLLYTDWKKPGDAENVMPSKLLWSLGNFSRFVRPGMVRVAIRETGAKHDLYGLVGTAYRDPVTRQTIAVYINSKPEPVELELRVENSSGLRWTPYVTSDGSDEDLKAHGVFPERQSYTVPGKSVVTFVSSFP